MYAISRHIVTLGLLLAVAAGCGKDKGGGESGGKRSKPAKLTIGEVLGDTKKPALLGPFATGKFGMTKEELAAAVPAFKEHGEFLSTQDFGIGFYADFPGPPSDRSAKKFPRKLGSLSITLTAADVKAVAAAWGPPTEITDRDKPASVWLNPEAKIRALLTADKDTYSLRIVPYLPAKEILGEPGKPLGIEGAKAFIGSTPAELQAAYPENFERDMQTLSFMSWAPDEYGDGFQMELGTDGGKIKTLQFWLHHGMNDKLKADHKALLEAKYGPAKEVTNTLGSKELQLAESPKVTIKETTGAWVIEVGYP